MPVSQYFNSYSSPVTNEQRLMEDVVEESINIMGHNCYYIPREHFNEDDFIFGENVNNDFKRAYLMAFYLANVQGFEGDGNFFSKFGLEIRQTSNFIVARREFQKYIPSVIAARPREGDLIYVPVLRKLFEVKFIEHELMFHSIGRKDPLIYELRTEVFRFSHETLDTGVAEIDNVAPQTEYTIQINVGAGTGNFFIGETVYQGANLNYSTAEAQVKEWDKSANTLYLINISGDFNTTGNVIGTTSNASYVIAATDPFGDYSDYDLYNNKQFMSEANNYIDLSQKNPFGMP
jgi:hypothetical protein